MTDGQIEYIAEHCHEMNRAYCELIDDKSHVPWKSAPDWQKRSTINGVKFILSNSTFEPSDAHESWMREKIKDGWSYGEIKDPEKKTHPCFKAYEELPQEQKTKDFIFVSTIRMCERMMR